MEVDTSERERKNGTHQRMTSDIDTTERNYLEDELSTLTTKSLDRLFELWTMIGFKSIRHERSEVALGHVKGIFDTMIAEEEKNLDHITKSIKKYDRERVELYKDLGENFNIDASEADLPLVEVGAKIKLEVFALQERKAKRMEVYNSVRETEKTLCAATGSVPLDVKFDRMPTDVHVKQIEKHVVQLKELRRNRETEFESVMDEIRRYYDRLEIEPRNSQERHLVCSIVDEIQLSSETMVAAKDLLQSLEYQMNTNNETAKEIIDKIQSISEKLKMPVDMAAMQHEFYSSRMLESLREELTTLEVERTKHMDIFIKSAQNELDQMWAKCFVSNDVKTTFYAVLDSKDDDQEAILNHYESNLDHWKKYWDEHLLIITKVNEWFSLWDDVAQLEEKGKDPSRLGNFRALREEERQRGRVKKRLPVLVKELTDLTQKYFSEHGKDFLINGSTFENLNISQEAKKQNEKSMEMDKKKAEKMKTNLTETIYGSVPKKTPMSANRTVRQVKRLQHDTKLLSKTGKSFATPKTPVRTPGRMALRERNESIVAGCNMTKGSIASVDAHMFNHNEVASSTLRHDQLRAPTPGSSRSQQTFSSLRRGADKSRNLRSAKKIPFIL